MLNDVPQFHIPSNIPDFKINVGFIGHIGHGIKRSRNLSAFQESFRSGDKRRKGECNLKRNLQPS